MTAGSFITSMERLRLVGEVYIVYDTLICPVLLLLIDHHRLIPSLLEYYQYHENYFFVGYGCVTKRMLTPHPQKKKTKKESLHPRLHASLPPCQ